MVRGAKRVDVPGQFDIRAGIGQHDREKPQFLDNFSMQTIQALGRPKMVPLTNSAMST